MPLGGEVARGDAGAAGGEHDAGPGGDGLRNGGADGLSAVGHDDDFLDDDVVGAQELDGQRSGGVLALAGGAAVGDGDDGALDGLE